MVDGKISLRSELKTSFLNISFIQFLIFNRMLISKFQDDVIVASYEISKDPGITHENPVVFNIA